MCGQTIASFWFLDSARVIKFSCTKGLIFSVVMVRSGVDRRPRLREMSTGDLRKCY